ncbi:MAG: site-specific integrase [Oscillospiraceae bacterium]|nr:site-specific integrase [Oscillospiraceae bacterium]
MATITKRGDTYRIRASCGYDSTGKQIMKSMTWKPLPRMTQKQIEKELERQKVLFEEKCRSGHYVDPHIKFEAFAEQWFTDYAKDHLRDRTYYRYKQLSVRTYAAMGHLPLLKISPQVLLNFYSQLAERGQNQRTGGGLSEKTIKHYHTFISSVMDRAIKWGAITDNPCKRIDTPKVTKKQLDFMNEEEIIAFLNALENENTENRCIFITLIYTGLRRSELLGLEWQDIDFDSGVISVVRTSQYVKEKGTYTDTTKTTESQRSIKASGVVIEALKKHKAAQGLRREEIGDKWIKSNRVFTQINGLPMSPNTPYQKLQKILKRNGLRSVSLHSLRHSNATLLINQGVNIKTVSGRLGHSQTSTTLNIYAHQIKSADAAASDAIEMAIGRQYKEKQKELP